MCLWGFQSALGVFYLIQHCPLLSGGAQMAARADAAGMPAGDFILCLMTLRRSVWGKGHFRELSDPEILHSEISETGL